MGWWCAAAASLLGRRETLGTRPKIHADEDRPRDAVRGLRAACCRFGRDSLLSGRSAGGFVPVSLRERENPVCGFQSRTEAAAGCVASKRQQAACSPRRAALLRWRFYFLAESPREIKPQINGDKLRLRGVILDFHLRPFAFICATIVVPIFPLRVSRVSRCGEVPQPRSDRLSVLLERAGRYA